MLAYLFVAALRILGTHSGLPEDICRHLADIIRKRRNAYEHIGVVYIELREAKHELGANNKGTKENVHATMHRNNGSKKHQFPHPAPKALVPKFQEVEMRDESRWLLRTHETEYFPSQTFIPLLIL